MVYVVVLSYRAPDDLRRCIDSVLRTEYPPERFRLVVVDNASEEATRLLLAQYGDRIDAIFCEENTGYAGGMNIGIRHAMLREAEYVLLLNQDTDVDPNWITQLVMAAESDPRIGAVQPRVMLGGGGNLVNSIGNEIHVLGFGFAGGHRERWSDLRQRMQGFPYPEVTYPSGAAVLYRTSALRDIAFPRDGKDGAQYLDEDYFLYHEDLDIGVRLWLRGWRCVLAPLAVVTHYYEFSRSITKLYWMERNRLLFLFQNFRLPTLLLLAPALIVSEIGLFVIAKRSGWAKQKLRSWGSLLNPKQWMTYGAHRREKQRRRKQPDRAMVRRFTSVLASQEIPSVFVERIANPMVTLWWKATLPFIRW